MKLIFSEADHTQVEWLPLELIPWGVKGKKGKGLSQTVVASRGFSDPSLWVLWAQNPRNLEAGLGVRNAEGWILSPRECTPCPVPKASPSL